MSGLVYFGLGAAAGAGGFGFLMLLFLVFALNGTRMK